ncbi:LLM class flavin-dependent oxidoreductase [Nocardia sp. NPDC059240]|uniref:LLM class flavin-dependent oxidoreductase n=1 Tax=Nocardia sp. NPDC059240 TaxID=3346786 RepID=UPI0036B7D36A
MASDSEYRTGLFALGIELDGQDLHPDAWRSRVHAAENAGFTFATIDDSLQPPGPGSARLDASVRAGFVAATTSTLGLVPVIAPTYAEPFHISSQLATLDYASRGRAGWLATNDPAAASTWGATPRTTEPELRRERVDAIEAARRLWDSWEDDAVIRDYAAGKFLDRDKLHHIDFIGETFSVKGPAIVPRPPQGQVVVFGYGTAESEGIDVALVSGPTVAAVITAASAARAAGIPRVLVDIDVTLDTATTARQRHGHRTAGTTGLEPAALLPDAATGLEPAPLLPDAATDLEYGNGPTSPVTAAEPESTGRLAFSGTPSDLVALLTELAPVADGVRLHPAQLDEDLPILARYVLPALLRTGLAHRPVPGSTLRENLGLARPVNRYAKEFAR